MIKKFLLGIGLTLLGATSFTNAGVVEDISFYKVSSIYDNNYQLGFLKGGAVLSDYLGWGKSILALKDDTFFRWTPNGQPYFYNPDFQGFFGEYWSCNEITGVVLGQTNYAPTNCTATPITGDYKALWQAFFSKVKQGDRVYYDFYSWYNQGNGYDFNRGIHVCWSSSEVGKSLCFRYSNGGNSHGIFYDNYGSLVNSQNLSNVSYSSITDSRIGYAPGQNGYNGSRDNEENNTNTNTNSNYACPTVAEVMQNMGSNYNTGLCYNNTSYFNGTNFEQVEKEDIFTIFNDNYQDYTNRISIYRNNCTNANTSQACKTAFSGEYKKYSIIGNANNSKVDEKKLRNYCNLGLNYDPNTTTCVISGGGIKEPYTNEELLNNIINNGIIPTPDTNIQNTGDNGNNVENNVLNALNKCEDGDRDCYVNNRNFIDSLKNIYGKITGLFKERNGVNGIIPNYILRITFLTILFTVIFKK